MDSHSRHSHENSDSWHGRRGKDHGRELPRGRSPRGRRQERDWRRSNNFLEDQRSRDGMDPRSRDNMNPRSRDKMDSRSRDNLDPRSRDNMDSRSRDNLDNAESGDHWPDFKEPERRFPDLESRFPDTHSRFSDVTPLIPASVSALPPPVPASAVPGAEEAADKSEGERSIDLDTRLQMLMKGKASNMPAFLMGSSGAETSDNEQVPEPPPPAKHTGVLSRTPSPFASREEYTKSHEFTLHHDELEQVNAALANIPPLSKSGLHDGMSPISDHDGMHHSHFPGQSSHFPGAPGYWQGQFPPPYQSWDPGQYNNPMYWKMEEGQYNYGSREVYDHHDHDDINQETPQEGRKGTKDRLKSLMDNVIKVVENELKSILKKDINKKLCESYAYLLFDKWWSEQETKYKLEQEAELKRKAGTSGTTALIPDRERVVALPRIPKPEDLGNLIEMQRESGISTFGAGGSLGLGFRGSIPKFSRKPEKKPEHSKVPEKPTEKDKTPEKKKKKKKDKHRELETEQKEEKKKGPTSTALSAIYSDSEDSDKEKK